jgi:hypothetical protein
VKFSRVLLCLFFVSLEFLAGCGHSSLDRLTLTEGQSQAKVASGFGAKNFVRIGPSLVGLSAPIALAARAMGRLSSPCTISHSGFGQGVTAAHCVPYSAITDCSFLTVQ